MNEVLLNNEFFIEIKQCPITSIILIINVLIWFNHFAYDISTEKVSFNYKEIIGGQYWRVISSTFSHSNIIHLILNSISIWNTSKIEIIKGSYYYFKYNHYIGYSCVCFGLLVIYIKLITNSIISYYPFLCLIYSCFMIKNASIIGHFNGIIIGALINIDLFEKYLPINKNSFYVITLIIFICFIINLYKTLPNLTIFKFNNNNNNNNNGNINFLKCFP
ncbi:hypothetical protein DDB_G0271574 [Dictyostelium discoideum AX4]|uniref:Peptidase S54 rhomboid domain-containing protein n=1 Tax=Dictyostelium discoideum TaxID=44689 RepID=Q55AV6_DICDI|nr:hypothetical protein DDB_G0271574 [Dictyostelium discoideum AX4]EAL71651.1 hypothetical protein DDB_G0271574 [Dictyostelium discoideum AX4]|eukprot:XP_645590.1 hypothetical protein DDB_G0271574 [Dictyostelium discoideum AX4]